jgi:hypothetical protein
MTDQSHGGFEERLRAALTNRAAAVSASADAPGVSAVAARARQRRARRRLEAGTLALLVVIGAGVGVAVGTSGSKSGSGGGSGVGQAAARAGTAGGHHLDRSDGVLRLPLAGTVTASAPSQTASAGEKALHGGNDATGVVPTTGPVASFNGAATPPGSAQGATASGVTASPTTTGPSGPIDVAPSSSTPFNRLYGHTSPDGVQMTAFDQPAGGSGSAPAFGPVGTFSDEPPVGDCLTTTQLTIEISDVDAVGTASEPLFKGASGALVDVQVGEIGDAEGAPATWVLAQVGSGAATVQVEFADGSIDQAAVPPSGVVVLGHKGTAAAALGNGSVAAINVVGPGGQVLAGYGLGTVSSVSDNGGAPDSLPAPGAVQPADPGAATTAVTHAITTALGCSASPLQRLQAIAMGDAVEAAPTFGGSAVVNVERVVFTSATAAVVQYDLNASGQGAQSTGHLYAAATLTGDTWQISLASVAPGIQVTPANQVGNVTVAPGGPLFVKSWPGGTAVAVYKALPGSDSASGYGTGDAACTPAGGIVEEVTTPGAVHVLTSALFPNYTTPLIDAAVSEVGSAEGAPATVVDVETGSQTSSVSVTGSAGTVQESPVDSVAVIVLAGAPTTTLAAAGSQIQVTDSTGAVLSNVSLQVEASAPAGPSTLPSSVPAAGPGPAPADPQAATQAITQAYAAVFDCTTPPIQRVQEIQDGSLVAGALEELDTGPYEALASSSYLDVSHVVFESPTLADVGYTLRFHSDAQLTFSMVGQAVVVSGSWRVSYATICAAIQLGLGNCQS